MSERIDDETAARLVFDAVRTAIRAQGGDTTEAPFDRLDDKSKAVWLEAWRLLAAEFLRRDYIFAHYGTVRRMAEGDPIAALWRNLEAANEAANGGG